MQCLTTVTDYIKQENIGEVGLTNEGRHQSHMTRAIVESLHTDIGLK